MAKAKNDDNSQDQEQPATQKPDEVPAIPRTTIGGAPAQDLSAAPLLKETGDKGVLMVFPKPVRITLDDRRVISFPPGTRRVPSFLANVVNKKTGEPTGKMHWYLEANGVTLMEAEDQ